MTDEISQPGRLAILVAMIGEVAVDVAGAVGAGGIVYGVDLIYHPAAFIVAGAFILTAAWRVARSSQIR